MSKSNNVLPFGFEVRCDTVTFNDKVGFVFYKFNNEAEKEYAVKSVSESSGFEFRELSEGEELKALFTLSYEQISVMMQNIDKLLNNKGVKIDLRRVLETEIIGLKNTLEEKDKIIALLKDELSYNKSNVTKLMDSVLKGFNRE